MRGFTVMECSVKALERGLGLIASLIMLALMLLVTADVVLRYAFNAPLGWAYDLISLYMMAAVFFLAVSEAYAHGAHVSVDILLTNARPAARRLSEVLTCVIGIVFFFLIAKAGTARALENFSNDDRLSGLIAWPMWPATALVPIGSGLLILRLAARLAGHLASLATGRDIIPAPVPEHAAVE